jgi:hypothetical protein
VLTLVGGDDADVTVLVYAGTTLLARSVASGRVARPTAQFGSSGAYALSARLVRGRRSATLSAGTAVVADFPLPSAILSSTLASLVVGVPRAASLSLDAPLDRSATIELCVAPDWTAPNCAVASIAGATVSFTAIPTATGSCRLYARVSSPFGQTRTLAFGAVFVDGPGSTFVMPTSVSATPVVLSAPETADIQLSLAPSATAACAVSVAGMAARCGLVGGVARLALKVPAGSWTLVARVTSTLGVEGPALSAPVAARPYTHATSAALAPASVTAGSVTLAARLGGYDPLFAGSAVLDFSGPTRFSATAALVAGTATVKVVLAAGAYVVAASSVSPGGVRGPLLVASVEALPR